MGGDGLQNAKVDGSSRLRVESAASDEEIAERSFRQMMSRTKGDGLTFNASGTAPKGNQEKMRLSVSRALC